MYVGPTANPAEADEAAFMAAVARWFGMLGVKDPAKITVSTFLNRILGLTVAAQNTMFSYVA